MGCESREYKFFFFLQGDQENTNQIKTMDQYRR